MEEDFKIILGAIILIIIGALLGIVFSTNNEKPKVIIQHDTIKAVIIKHEEKINDLIIKQDEELNKIDSLSDSAAVELFKELLSK